MKQSVLYTTLFACLFCFQQVTVTAQNISAGDLRGLREDTVPKEIIDHATIRVYYTMTHQPDPQKKGRWKAITLLQVGSRATKFMDYYSLRGDSINDTSIKQKVPFMQYFAALTNAHRKANFNEDIITDQRQKKLTVQQDIVPNKYQYEEEVPSFQWALLKGDTVIDGYACRKAHCDFRGRSYTAWYAPDIDMPFGPYKFSGLPGLIMQIADDEGMYSFALSGLEQVNYYDPIYIVKRTRTIPTQRKNVLRIYKNFCEEPGKYITADGSVQIPEETLATIEPKPYNPIELE
jgi:GLPGLI family protein